MPGGGPAPVTRGYVCLMQIARSKAARPVGTGQFSQSRPCVVCHGGTFRHLTHDGGYDWETCDTCGFVRLTADLSFAEEVDLQDADAATAYIDSYAHRIGRKMARTRQRLRLITRHVKRGRFLDVGSNYGFMTEMAGRAGFDVVGLEINPGLVEHARRTFPQRRFVNTPLETFDAAGERFDAVYCSEVIEHVIDPRRFLQVLAGLMRSGAVLLLTTPHIREYRRRGYRDMKAPDHKLYFDNSTLSRLLRDCGFHRLRFRFNPFKGIVLTAFRI